MKSQDTDPRIQIRIEIWRIRNTGFKINTYGHAPVCSLPGYDGLLSFPANTQTGLTPGPGAGLGSALSPAEIRAAEVAEQLLEQEKRDALLAQRLQVRQLTQCGGSSLFSLVWTGPRIPLYRIDRIRFPIRIRLRRGTTESDR